MTQAIEKIHKVQFLPTSSFKVSKNRVIRKTMLQLKQTVNPDTIPGEQFILHQLNLHLTLHLATMCQLYLLLFIISKTHPLHVLAPLPNKSRGLDPSQWQIQWNKLLNSAAGSIPAFLLCFYRIDKSKINRRVRTWTGPLQSPRPAAVVVFLIGQLQTMGATSATTWTTPITTDERFGLMWVPLAW